LAERISSKVIRNTMYNAVSRVCSVIVGLFLTPYVVHHLGLEQFGVWAIIGVVTGYFGLLDLGIGASFVKYISEFYARKDFEEINQVINAGFIFYAALAVVIVLLAVVFVDPLMAFFKIPAYLRADTRFVFIIGIILFAVSGVLSPFNAVLSGLQRMDIYNKIAIGISLINVIGTVVVLEHGYGLRGLILNNAVIFLLAAFCYIIADFRILPELKFDPLGFSRDIFKKMFSFGWKLQIARLSSMISMHIDKIIINYFLSLGMVTFYQLASSIIETLKSILLLLPSALLPAFSEIDARGERGVLLDGYYRGTRYMGIIVIPVIIFVMVCAPQIMMVWMGPGYDKSAWIIRVLGVGWGIAVLSALRSPMVQALVKPEIEMEAGLAAMIFNIPLSIMFIIKFGFLGAALGTSFSLLISVLYGYVRLHKEIKVPFFPFIKETVSRVALIGLCVGVCVWGLTHGLNHFAAVQTRGGQLLVFIGQTAVFFGLYLLTLAYFKPLDDVDVAILTRDRHILIAGFLRKFSGGPVSGFKKC
jgi:O-antigen/teichoic acid export membrane protein